MFLISLVDLSRVICSQKVLNSLALVQKLLSGLLDASLRNFVINVESSDGSVSSVAGSARH